ncbi:MAG TPA: hypothetical protein VEJ63_23295 [Planctomycetota bacterium]|nr:hypothetical protein [Planctomycetota bacterium]
MTIEPYVSADGIKFGVSQTEVELVAGLPNEITNNRRGEKELHYSPGFTVRLDGKHGVVEIAFRFGSKPVIRGVDVFNDGSAFQKLVTIDGDPYSCFGFIVLLNVGIALTGFHDDDTSQKAVTAFCRGRWDVMKSQLRKYDYWGC